MWLDTATTARAVRKEVELWCLGKNRREVRCVGAYLPTGLDLRLMESDVYLAICL